MREHHSRLGRFATGFFFLVFVLVLVAACFCTRFAPIFLQSRSMRPLMPLYYQLARHPLLTIELARPRTEMYDRVVLRSFAPGHGSPADDVTASIPPGVTKCLSCFQWEDEVRMQWR